MVQPGLQPATQSSAPDCQSCLQGSTQTQTRLLLPCLSAVALALEDVSCPPLSAQPQTSSEFLPWLTTDKLIHATVFPQGDHSSCLQSLSNQVLGV